MKSKFIICRMNMSNSELKVQKPLSYVFAQLPSAFILYKMMQVFSRESEIIADGYGSYDICYWKHKNLVWTENVENIGIYR